MKSGPVRIPIIQKAYMYIDVFVCFATKVVHLEAMSDLTTALFIEMLWCFI